MRNLAFAVSFLLLAPAARAEETTLSKRSLAECVAIALREHPDLKAAGAAIDAGHQRTFAAASTILPQVNATYAANRRNTSATARTGVPLGTSGSVQPSSRTFNFYSSSVSLSQVLFDFGQTLNAIRAARASERSLDADRTTVREQVVLEVKQSYFDLLKAGRLLAVAEENVAQGQKHLELARARFQVGLAPRFDVTQAQVQLANAELAHLTARNNVALAHETLGTAMGLGRSADFEVVDLLDMHDVRITEAEALELANAHRPELVSQRAREEALVEQVSGLRKQYFPILTGDATYGWSGSEVPLQSNWNVGASVNLSVLNGGLTTAEIGEAKANLAELRFQTQSLSQQIALEVRQAVLNLAQATEAIRVSDTALVHARENLDVAEGRYHAGVGSIIELTDAQASTVGAEANHVQALSDYQTTLAALERATAQPLAPES